MPVFVSHRYFQRASSAIQRADVPMHRANAPFLACACWACIGRVQRYVYVYMLVYMRIYFMSLLFTYRSLSLLEIYLPRELHK